MALLCKGFGKRLDDIGETAGFGKRQAFGSYEEDSHARRGPRDRIVTLTNRVRHVKPMGMGDD